MTISLSYIIVKSLTGKDLDPNNIWNFGDICICRILEVLSHIFVVSAILVGQSQMIISSLQITFTLFLLILASAKNLVTFLLFGMPNGWNLSSPRQGRIISGKETLSASNHSIRRVFSALNLSKSHEFVSRNFASILQFSNLVWPGILRVTYCWVIFLCPDAVKRIVSYSFCTINRQGSSFFFPVWPNSVSLRISA